MEVLLDLAYGPDPSQKLDLYLPSEGTARPLVAWVHGGAFWEGDKDDAPRVLAPRLCEHGFAVASLNYRLSGEAIFPAQIHDCKAALRWLRAHASEFQLDASRFGVWGESAGGHLVSLLGTSGGVADLEGDVGGNLEHSSRVQAVCNWFGSSDLLKLSSAPSDWDHDAPDSPGSCLIGATLQENPDKAQRANPITYIDGSEPPFLVQHGDSDRTVPLNQSELLVEALRSAGSPVEFEVLPGVGHGFDAEAMFPRVLAFFQKSLG